MTICSKLVKNMKAPDSVRNRISKNARMLDPVHNYFFSDFLSFVILTQYTVPHWKMLFFTKKFSILL